MLPVEVGASLVDKEVSRMTIGHMPRRLRAKERRRPAILPTTRLGRGAVALAAANVVLVLGWRLMGPLGAFPGLACGRAGGIVALVAISRRGERAITVFAAIVPAANVVLFVLAELRIGHD